MIGSALLDDCYPLVNKHIYGKSPFYSWVNQLFLWAIFHSYVKLPEGKWHVACGGHMGAENKNHVRRSSNPVSPPWNGVFSLQNEFSSSPVLVICHLRTRPWADIFQVVNCVICTSNMAGKSIRISSIAGRFQIPCVFSNVNEIRANGFVKGAESHPCF